MPKPFFSEHRYILNSFIRVNHAGEYGAVRIYQGQLDAIACDNTKDTISHMLRQEMCHLKFFEREINTRHVRPTILMPIWHICGYMLGFVTSKIGNEAAMLCTQAVEEVIDKHYSTQVQFLNDNNIERELAINIEKFRLEEVEHKDIAILNNSAASPMRFTLYHLIKNTCLIAIALSKIL